MAKEKNAKVVGGTKRKVLTVLSTGFFAVLSAIIVFPVFAGLLASFRPGRELIRKGLAIDLDISTMQSHQKILNCLRYGSQWKKNTKNSIALVQM